MVGFLRSPFLNTGAIFASSQSLGNLPFSYDRVNNTASIGAILGTHILRTLAGMLSGPDAFFVSKEFKSCSMPSTENDVFGMVGCGELGC